MQHKYISDFFNSDKRCPDEIVNCSELRSEYYSAFNKLTSSSCKSCDLVELKNFFISRIKYNFTPHSFNENIFFNKRINKINKIAKKQYIFLFPLKIIFNVFDNYIQIISFRNELQKVSFIKKNYIFLHFKNKFLFTFFNKDDFLLYFWYSNNVATKIANIYKLNLKRLLKRL